MFWEGNAKRGSYPWDWPVTLFQGLARAGLRAPFQPPPQLDACNTHSPPPIKLTGVSAACPGSSGTQRLFQDWRKELGLPLPA